MNNWKDKTIDATKERAVGVRFRAWSLTAIIIITLVFYLLVNVIFNQVINFIDIVIVIAIQNMATAIWFPEGAMFGEQNPTFKANRRAYNKRATLIATQQKTANLREFCVYDFEQRKKMFLEKMLGRISIDVKEFEILKTLPIEIIEGDTPIVLKEATEEEPAKEITLNKTQKRVLKKLIFEEIHIEMNNPDTIMSGLEIDEKEAIKNAEATYKRKVFIIRALQSVVVAITIAYIGYTLKDGVGLPEIVRILVYITSLLSVIVISFNQGEESIKVHKNMFMLQLINFLDRFFEYAGIEAVKNESDNKIEEKEEG